MLMIHRWLRPLSHEVQSTLPSPLVRSYIQIQKICQWHMPMSTVCNAHWWIQALAYKRYSEYAGTPSIYISQMIWCSTTLLRSAGPMLTPRTIVGQPGGRCLSQYRQAWWAQGLSANHSQITSQGLTEAVANTKQNGTVGTWRITPATQRSIWQTENRGWSSIRKR